MLRTIGTRLLVAFFCVVSLMMLQAYLGYRNLRILHTLHADAHASEQELLHLERQAAQMRFTALQILGTSNPAHMDSLGTSYAHIAQQLDSGLQAAGLDARPFQACRATYDRIIDLHRNFADIMAREVVSTEVPTVHMAFRTQLIDAANAVRSAEEAEFGVVEARLRRQTIEFGVTALLVAVAWALALQRTLVGRRQMEVALQQRERNLQITLDSIGDAVIATDVDGRVTRFNPVAERLTGWRREEAIGRPLADVFAIVAEDTGLPVADPLQRILDERRTLTLPSVLILVSRDGGRVRIADSGAPIRDASDAVVGSVIVFRDVTRQLELEERVRQAQKMDAVGQLAGGVAHDFNNMLAAIVGYGQLLQESLAPEDSDGQRYVASILRAANRSADLVRKLLDFSRKGKRESRPVDVHQLIGEVVGLLQHGIDRSIQVSAQFGAARHDVMGDAAQLQNALLNLGLNARDAMPDGGTLVFRTSVMDLDGTRLSEGPLAARPGPYLRIDVIDTGQGMDSQTQRRIFEPFFTTKEVGKGTGLGLAAVYGALQDHHGAIEVESAPESGSCFRLFLPLSNGERVPETGGAALTTAGHGGTVLVVEDERILRDLAVSVLTRLGYTVLLASDGLDAERVLGENLDRVDLVLLDLIMPRRGGAETFPALRAIAPQLRVMIVSGFSRDERVSEMLAAGAAGFLQKPYTREDLAHAVARALAQPRAS